MLTLINLYYIFIPCSGVPDVWFWQNPAVEQNGAQQGQPKFELQLPDPFPALTVSSAVHDFPFHEVHDPIDEMVDCFVGAKKNVICIIATIATRCDVLLYFYRW